MPCALAVLKRVMSSNSGSVASPSAQEVVANWRAVTAGIAQRCQELRYKQPTLVAVSKTKPAHLVQALYDAGHRDFGENYVHELVEKSNELADSCPDIRWHFIGHLQSNKAKLVVAAPHLHVIETVDSVKLARKLNDLVLNQTKAASATTTASRPLRVMVQVNTSNEENKSGAQPGAQTLELVKEVRALPGLAFQGLMTIGAFAATPDQPDFRCLVEQRAAVCAALGLTAETSALEEPTQSSDTADAATDASSPPTRVLLSMGMSHDHLQAIEFGSNNVRVGSTIFGARLKKPSSPQSH